MMRDLQRRVSKEFSSTVREVRGKRKTLAELHRVAPWLLACGHVQIWGDNAAAITCCALMRSNLRVWREVLALHKLALRMGLTLSLCGSRASTWTCAWQMHCPRRRTPATGACAARSRVSRSLSRLVSVGLSVICWRASVRIRSTCMWQSTLMANALQ